MLRFFTYNYSRLSIEKLLQPTKISVIGPFIGLHYLTTPEPRDNPYELLPSLLESIPHGRIILHIPAVTPPSFSSLEILHL